MIVVDASVAVKWLFSEPGSTDARALFRSGMRLRAPDLLRVEVAAALLRKHRMGFVGEEHVRAALAVWGRWMQAGAVATTADSMDLPAAVGVALDIRHPLQDCLYLALAERLSAPLVTADPKFVSRAIRRYPSVHMLGSEA